jgi:hypothetical protein
VLGPLNSLLWYNAVHTFLKVYMELDSSFLFLQEQIKDIIIITLPQSVLESYLQIDP